MSELEKNPAVHQDDEIDLIELAKTIWKGRKLIFIAVMAGTIIGLVVALLSPKAYTSSTTLVPQTSQSSANLGGLSSLASIAGFNLNMSQGGGELSPNVYPQIIQSIPFQLEILNEPFVFSGIDKQISLFDYYSEYFNPGLFSEIKKYTLGLPGVIIKAIKGKPSVSVSNSSGLPTLTEEQAEILEIISESVYLEINEKQGYLQLSVTMPEAGLSAQVAQFTKELLQKYITEFKIEKAKAQLDFIEGRYNEKKAEYEKAQADLAAFIDRNKNVTSALARTQEDKLQSDFQLAFNVYSELSKQLEQSKIKVKEDTPVFSTISPVVVPLKKSKPNRPMILIVWVFLGFVIGLGWIFGRQYINVVKERWNIPDNLKNVHDISEI